MIATSTISQNWKTVGYCAHSLRVWNDTSAGPKCFISQFCVVAKVAIIQKKNPNLAIHQMWKDFKKKILLCFWATDWTYKIVFSIKIKWRTHGIEGSVPFYGMTIQEETTVINEFGAFVP
jgi:hypothetical protein